MIGFPPLRRGGRKLEAPLAPVPPAEQIGSRILLVRGQKVLLDAELARLYGVSTGRLHEQVKRNLERFPADFMFQLTKQEVGTLRSQFAMSNAGAGRGGRRHAPFAFVEHGAIMAATVLNSPRAIAMSLYVVRAFVRLRGMISAWTPMTTRSARSCGPSASSQHRPSRLGSGASGSSSRTEADRAESPTTRRRSPGCSAPT